jgi:hypothetical protein
MIFKILTNCRVVVVHQRPFILLFIIIQNTHPKESSLSNRTRYNLVKNRALTHGTDSTSNAQESTEVQCTRLSWWYSMSTVMSMSIKDAPLTFFITTTILLLCSLNY